jgi:Spy/CpxP family protein refolding chaperone
MRLTVFAKFVVLTLAVLVVTDICTAQEGGRRRRGSPFREGRWNKSMLMRSSQVRDELKLTDDQKTKIDAVIDESRSSFRDSGFSGLRDLPEAERKAKYAEIGQKLQAAAKELDAKVVAVLDEAQQKRLNEIHLQVRGVNALTDETVATQLNLTAEQKQKITDLIAAERDVQDELRGGDDLSREERRKKAEENRPKLEELRKETEKAANDSLTDAQKEQ